MSTEAHKAVIRRYWEALNEGNIDGAVALASEDVVNHSAIPEAQGAAGMRRIFEKLYAAMPDMRWTCEDLIAEGDRVVCRMTSRATNTGSLDFKNLQLPATGKTCTVESIHVFRMSTGRIAEHWGARDDVAMFRQLGIRPTLEVQP